MRLFFFCLLILNSLILSAQEIVDTPFERGVVEDGRRAKIWEFYDEDHELELKIDFSTGRMYHLKPDTSSFVIKEGGKWVKSKLALYPIYALGTHNFHEELKKAIRFPRPAIFNGFSGRVSVMFVVDSTGRAKDFEIVEKFGYGCDYEVLRAIQEIPNLWIPAMKDGKRYDSRFVLPVIFVNGKIRFSHKNFKDEAKHMRPVQIALPIYNGPNYEIVDVKARRTPTYVVKRRDNFIEEYEVLKGTDIKNGSYVSYNIITPNVQIVESGNYKDGKRQGLWQEFHTGDHRTLFHRETLNKLRAAGNYEDDRRHGTWEYYHLMTEQPSDIVFNQGQDGDGKSLTYSVQQQELKLRLTGKFDHGKRAGIWVDLNFSGDTIRIFNHTTHELIRDSEYDLNDFRTSPKALYDGGTDFLHFNLFNYFDLSHVVGFINKDSVSALLLVTIDATGKTGNIKLLQGNMAEIVVKEIALAFKQCNDWVPVYKENIPQVSSNVYSIVVTRKTSYERGATSKSYGFKVKLLNHGGNR